MNKQIKAKWVAALRSGKYIQTTGLLRRSQPGDTLSHCCLGVLCDLAPEGEWASDSVYSHSKTDYSGGALPEGVVKWAGLSSNNPVVLAEPVRNLSDVNDSGATFDEIADIIEKEL